MTNLKSDLKKSKPDFEKMHNLVVGHLGVQIAQAPRTQLDEYERRSEEIHI